MSDSRTDRRPVLSAVDSATNAEARTEWAYDMLRVVMTGDLADVEAALAHLKRKRGQLHAVSSPPRE